MSDETRVGAHLAALIDKNGDSLIDYQEFFPVCFSMIVEILSDKVRPLNGVEYRQAFFLIPLSQA